MRRTNLFIAVLFLSGTVLCFNSCKKADPQNSPGKEIISTVNGWLNSQKSGDKPNTSAKIQKLQDNLDFSGLRVEQFTEEEHFIVIPVRTSFKSANNADKDPVNNLLLFINKTGNIRRGNIVQFIPENRQKNETVPVNTFFKYFNSQQLDCDGQFSFLNIVEELLYEFKYQNGKFRSFGIVKPKESGKGSGYGGNNTQCFDRFLITTTYHEDGSVEVEEEYLYTYCVCVPGTRCDELEGGTGSGSGADCCIPDPNVKWSTGSEIEKGPLSCGPETINPATGLPMKICTITWSYSPVRFSFWSWKYKSTEQSKIEKVGTEWKFIVGGTTHLYSGLDGTIPPCISFNHSVNATPSISGDRREAKMRLDYTNTLRVSCWILSPAISETLKSEVYWYPS